MVDEKEVCLDFLPNWQIIFQIIIGTVVMSENALLLVIIFINKKLHTTSYYFIASLAISDLLVSIHYLLGTTLHSRRVFAAVPTDTMLSMLTFNNISITGVVMLSFTHMSVIAIERYLYVARPFLHQRHLKRQRIRWIISLLWILYVLYVTVIFVVERLYAKRFIVDFEHMSVHLKLGIFFGIYCVMTFVTLVCYLKILCVVRTKRLNPYTSCLAKRVYKNGEFSRSVKFFLLVFGLYFIMTFPTLVTECFNGILPMQQGLRKAFQPLPIIHCGCNFIVLLLVDSRFRKILGRNVKYSAKWKSVSGNNNNSVQKFQGAIDMKRRTG